jgi:hypothetical protein
MSAVNHSDRSAEELQELLGSIRVRTLSGVGTPAQSDRHRAAPATSKPLRFLILLSAQNTFPGFASRDFRFSHVFITFSRNLLGELGFRGFDTLVEC